MRVSKQGLYLGRRNFGGWPLCRGDETVNNKRTRVLAASQTTRIKLYADRLLLIFRVTTHGEPSASISLTEIIGFAAFYRIPGTSVDRRITVLSTP